MASTVVGVILMLAIEIVAGVAFFSSRDEWSGKPESPGDSAREKCSCEPPTNEDGSMCEPVSLPDRYGIAWRCEVKPALMYPGRHIE